VALSGVRLSLFCGDSNSSVNPPTPAPARGEVGVGAVSTISGIESIGGTKLADASDGRAGAILRGESVMAGADKGDGPTGSADWASASRAGDSAMGLGRTISGGGWAGAAASVCFTEVKDPASESERGVEGLEIVRMVEDRRITLPTRERKDLFMVDETEEACVDDVRKKIC